MRGRGLLAALMALALVPWGAEDAVRADTQTGDFNIAVDMVFENDTIIPDGNITVTGGATLTLINCNITMRDFFSIRVDPGSGLVMRNVFLRGVLPGVPNNFFCEGRLYMDNCTLYNFRTWSLNSLTGDCSIIDCDFSIAGVGIEIKAGAPLLRGNRFIALEGRSYLAPMVYSRNASPVIENNTFEGYQMRYDGLEVYYPDSPVIANNTFLNCSVGLGYYYVHQHAPDGTVSPPPGGAAIIDGNIFRKCLYGMVAADSPQGNGMGRGAPAPRVSVPDTPVFIARDNDFRFNTGGIYATQEMPSVIEGNEFWGNAEGIRLESAWGVRLERNRFTNNSVGLFSSSGELNVANCTFSTNDRNLVSSDSAAIVEGCTFYGGVNTSVSIYTYSATGAYFANNTVNGGTSIGLRVEGTAVVYNNTFRDCPFGVYRAVRLYGQGHGRDSQQPPDPQPDMAIIEGNRFENNTRGIYTEGWTNVWDNDFTGNRAGVEASRYIHPEESYTGYYQDNGYFDQLSIYQSSFTNNTEGILILCAGFDDSKYANRYIWYNDFAGNAIGIDIIESSGDFSQNDFSKNGGWAFRNIESENDLSDNIFGGCGRVWSQALLEIYVRKAPDNDLDAPYSNYRPSANATVRVTGRSGELLLEGRTDQFGMPPQFSSDGFEFWATNLTTGLELAGGSTCRTGPAAIEAWKPGKGAASVAVDLDKESYTVLYLEPVPDIQVGDFLFTRNPAVAGDYLSANFTVRNDNTYDPSNVSLQDVEVVVALDGAPVETFTIPWLRAGDRFVGHVEWTAEPGNHTWTVTADPNGIYKDFDRENNRALLTLPINGHPEPVLEADRVQAFTAERFIFSGAGSRDDGTVAAYMFDYGDGTPAEWSANAAGVHEYARPGVYGVRLKVRDDLGLESGWSEPVLVNVTNRLPTVELRPERTDILTLETANFTVSVSDPEDVSLTVAWDFGDGGRISGRDMLSAAHVYANDGCFTVTARVADSDSGEATASLVVTVRNRPPIARFSASPVNGTVLTRFSFLPECSDPDGRIASYLWDMGDNSSSIVDRPFHVYARPGIYNVTLTVQDDDGVPSEPFKLAIAVWNTPPAARVRLAQQSPRAGQALTFDASASFDAESSALVFRWDFGDGTTADGPSVRHSFAKPGNYTVRVRVADSEGAVSEAVLPVFVSGPEPSGEETGWLSTAVISGILTLAGLMFLAWVLTHRPERPPPVQKPVRRVRRPKNHDYYAEKLAESRKMRAAKENSNRSLYDAMQPRRDGEAREPGNRGTG